MNEAPLVCEEATDSITNYIPTATASRMHQDDASLVKLLFGPLGCLPGETEFLTPSGWKRLDEYKKGDAVAEWNPDNGSIAYNSEVDYVRLPATQWYNVTWKDICVTCSEEHNFPFIDSVTGFGLFNVTELRGRIGKFITDPTHAYFVNEDSVVNVTPSLCSDIEKFCFTTSSGYFVIRSKGNVLVSGNSGKSVAMVMELLSRALSQKPHNGVRRSRAAIIRSTYPELKTTTIQTFIDWIPQSICPIKWSPPITGRLQLDDIGDGTALDFQVVFLALDNPQDIEKLKSLELTFAWINEASGVKQDVLDMLVGRIGRFPAKKDGGASWTGVVMDSNLVDTDHWLYKLFEEEKPVAKLQDGSVRPYTVYKQPPALLYDPNTKKYSPNPDAENIENHILGYDYYLQQLPGKKFDWINVYVLGNYGSVRDGKVVYPSFSEDVHVGKHLSTNQALPVYVGLDFGLTPSAVFAQHTPDGRLIVLRDLTSSESGIRRFAQELLVPVIGEYYSSNQLIFVGDPAGNQRAQTDERTCFQELRSQGIVVKAAPTNELRARLEAVDFYLSALRDGKPAFLIDADNCPTLLRGFRGAYSYRRITAGGVERFEEKPNKGGTSHVHDALQYIALLTRGIVTKGARQKTFAKPRNYYGASSIGGY